MQKRGMMEFWRFPVPNSFFYCGNLLFSFTRLWIMIELIIGWTDGQCESSIPPPNSLGRGTKMLVVYGCSLIKDTQLKMCSGFHYQSHQFLKMNTLNQDWLAVNRTHLSTELKFKPFYSNHVKSHSHQHVGSHWPITKLLVPSSRCSMEELVHISLHGHIMMMSSMETFSASLALCARNSPVTSGHWHGTLMFSLICAWINGQVNNREAGDLRHHLAHLWRNCNVTWKAGIGLTWRKIQTKLVRL